MRGSLCQVERDERLTILVLGSYDIPLRVREEAGPHREDGHAGSLETSVRILKQAVTPEVAGEE